jgi:hypothetical protein
VVDSSNIEDDEGGGGGCDVVEEIKREPSRRPDTKTTTLKPWHDDNGCAA